MKNDNLLTDRRYYDKEQEVEKNITTVKEHNNKLSPE